MARQLPLDVVSTSTCYGAYAAYRVSSSYVGATIKVRRGDNNSTADFYANAYGQLGTALNGTGTPLETWLGTATGYVTIWYDQSGRGNNATQSTAGSQPTIDYLNNRIDFKANAGLAFFSIPNGTVPTSTPYTVTVKHNTIGNNNGTWLGAASSLGNNLGNGFRRDTTSYFNYWYANDFQGSTNTYATGNIVTYAYDGNYNYLYINGTPQGVSPIRSGWNGQPGNECIGRSAYQGDYLNGELYSLFIFKSFLTINDRTHIEKPMSISNTTGPIKFSQLRTALGLTTSSTFAMSQAKMYAGIPSSSAAAVSDYNGYTLRNGLFMRIYWSKYHNNDPAFFNSNTPNITGVTTNLRNTYCATGGFNNTNYTTGQDIAIGGIGVNTVYSVEWVGLFYAPVTGTYTFYLNSDDGSRLWVGSNATSGYTTSNSNLAGGGAVEYSVAISLTIGTYYPFRLQYGDGGGGEFITFSFSPPSGVRVYEGTGYYFCQSINNKNNNTLSVYFPFESTNSTNIFPTVKARYIGFEYGNTIGSGRYINVMGVSVFTSYNGPNIINSSMTVTVTPSAAVTPGTYLIDNNDSTMFHTGADEYPVVIIDLGSEQSIHKVQLHNRTDCCSGRIAGGRLFLKDGNNVTFYTSNLIATKAGVTTYQDAPTHDGYLFYTWWPSVNTSPYGSDTVPYQGDPFSSAPNIPIAINNANSLYNATLYNGANISTTSFKLGSSSLSLTSASSQYASLPPYVPTANGLTFAFWYKSNGSPTWARVFDFGNGAANNNIFVASNGDGLNKFAISVFYGSTENKIYLTDINYNDNVWRHMVWTLTYATPNSYTSTWNLYINGVNKYNGSTNLYPSVSVTLSNCYLGRSNWANDGYYNGNIDEFRIYDSVLSDTDVTALYNDTAPNYTYTMLNGSTRITTAIQGTSFTNPATSGYAIYSANPWLPNGYYWIKSAAMPNALHMFVDIKNGGYDFYQIISGTSVNYITSTHSGIALGLELVIPRSQDSWRAIYAYVHTTLASNYPTWYGAMPIYKTSSGGNYSSYAMFDPRFGNSGSTAGSYNGAPDWTCKDGGLWYIKDIPWGEPNGDYYGNAFLGNYSAITYPQWLTPYGSVGFNDANNGYFTGANYLVSTNYAGSTVSTLYTYFDGSTLERAAPNALYIKNKTGTSTNGIYWINLPTVGPTQIYCIMDSTVDGGGWMMTMKATRGGTFNYDSSYWTTVSTLNPSDNTRNDADAKFHSMNYFEGKDMLALWPDIPSNYNSGNGGNLGNLGSIYIYWANDSANNTLKINTSTNSANVDNTHLPASYLLDAGTYTYISTLQNDSNDYAVVTLKNAANDSVITTITSGAPPWTFSSGLTGSFTIANSTRVYIHFNNNYYQYSTRATMNLANIMNPTSNWSWMKNNYNSGARQTLINYFSTVSNVSFGTAQGVECGTAFSTQNGAQFYGTNFVANGSNKVRWGFGWNNEGDWGSNDVSGGIGMSRVSYSAGDYIGCCQVQTGFNRSARIEMYIR